MTAPIRVTLADLLTQHLATLAAYEAARETLAASTAVLREAFRAAADGIVEHDGRQWYFGDRDGLEWGPAGQQPFPVPRACDVEVKAGGGM